METYTLIGELDERGFVEVKRADGKTARVKFTWLRPTCAEGVFTARSRCKQIRMGMLDWTT